MDFTVEKIAGDKMDDGDVLEKNGRAKRVLLIVIYFGKKVWKRDNVFYFGFAAVAKFFLIAILFENKSMLK